MLVFHSEAARLHDPSHFFRLGIQVPHPESAERYRLLFDAVSRSGHELQAAGDHGTAPVTRVHDPDYLAFLQNAWEMAVIEGETGEEINTTQFSKLPPLQRPKTVRGLMGVYCSDTSTGIRAGTWSAVNAAAQTAISAAEAVAGGASVAYGLCRPPGHHAHKAHGSGFCFLNNAAIAADHLRQYHDRIAILDIDVHHGDGTQRIFYERDDILTVSIHAESEAYFPHFTGHADERGAGDGAGFNRNIPLRHGAGDAEYLAAIKTGLDEITEYCPGALVVSLGLDAAADDPVGVLEVSQSGFQSAAKMISQTGLPTVLIQEGGYPSENLQDNLIAFLAGFDRRTGSIV